jgi:epoxyqueuosine reductase
MYPYAHGLRALAVFCGTWLKKIVFGRKTCYGFRTSQAILLLELRMTIIDDGKPYYNSAIASFFREREAGLLGFADLSPIPAMNRYDFPRSISFAFPLREEIVREIKNAPTPEYFAEYNRLNALLVTAAKELEGYIRSLGFGALAIEGAMRNYDPDALATILPHKTSATLAGLGWIGKCNLLITEEFGSAMRLSTVVTDIPLYTGTPVSTSRCGDCKICLEACPGKALTGKNWVYGMGREELYDAFACKETAQALSDAIGANHTICGVCMSHCPWTLRYINGFSRRP